MGFSLTKTIHSWGFPMVFLWFSYGLGYPRIKRLKDTGTSVPHGLLALESPDRAPGAIARATPPAPGYDQNAAS